MANTRLIIGGYMTVLKEGRDTLIEIGANVRRFRESHKPRLTQEQLARDAGITMGMVSKLERGEHTNPTIDTLEKISRALGVRITDLLEEPEAKAS